MDSSNKIKAYIKGLKDSLDGLDIKSVEKLVDILIDAYENEKQIFIFGNGGSGSTASHLACDLNKGCCYGRKKRFKVICLNDSIPTLTAYSNDVSYDVVFIEQLKNFLKTGDIVIGISGSGNSVNVLEAIEYANNNNAITVGLCGYNGGKLKKMVKHPVCANVDDMQKSEDIHLIIAHIIMQIIFEKLN